MKLAAVALCCALAAVAIADPDPPVWPEKFTADQTIVTTFKERPAKTFYDYSVPAQRTEQDGWCMPLFIGQTAKKWSCSFLILPAGIYHVAPDAKVKSNKCCMFAPGLAPSQPDWVSTMEYQGEEVEPESGILSDKYFAEGHSYWHSVEEDRPVAFGATTFMGPTKSVYSNYQEGVADPPKGWELPSIDGVDCDAECTRRSPSGEEDRPELHPETLAILMAEYNRRFGGY